MSRWICCLLIVTFASVSHGEDLSKDREVSLAQKDTNLELKKLKAKHEAELREVYEQYLKKLASIQEAAVKQNQFDRAIEIQKEKKRTEALIPLTIEYRPAGEKDSPSLPKEVTLSGEWREGEYPITISQRGNQITATCTYQHSTEGEVQWIVQGTIKDSGVTMFLVHTKPTKFKRQKRVGTLSKDGNTISGYTIHEGDDKKYWFEWTRK